MPTALPTAVAFLGPIGWQELLIIGVLGLLIFGRRLPEVGRSLGKGIVEFKKGLQGIEDDANATASAPPAQKPKLEGTASRGETLDPTADKTATHQS